MVKVFNNKFSIQMLKVKEEEEERGKAQSSVWINYVIRNIIIDLFKWFWNSSKTVKVIFQIVQNIINK